MIRMSRYILRLDDASEYMDLEKWKRMEALLDKYDIKPLFGIIPCNQDPSLVTQYKRNPSFWQLAGQWIKKGWVPAMHGYEHRYVTEDGGINPVNKRSEFAGLPYENQADKIRQAWATLKEHGIKPDIFFAPSHTFDKSTLAAIEKETPIRIISDTVAWDVYKEGNFWYIPQQSGRARKLPFKTATFCYHPNTMNDNDYELLESFLSKYKESFASVFEIVKNRKKNAVDVFLSKLYFGLRIIRNHSK